MWVWSDIKLMLIVLIQYAYSVEVYTLQQEKSKNCQLVPYRGYTLEEIKTAVYFVSHTLSKTNRRAELYSKNPDKLPTAYNVFDQRKFHHIR